MYFINTNHLVFMSNHCPDKAELDDPEFAGAARWKSGDIPTNLDAAAPVFWAMLPASEFHSFIDLENLEL